MKFKVNTNLASGILFLIFSIAIWILIPNEIDTLEKTEITARTVPKLITIIMFTLSILLIIQGLFSKHKEKDVIEINLKKESRTLIMMLIFVAYGIIMNFVGFAIASIVLCTAMLMFYKTKKWHYYIITYAVVLLVNYVFETLLFVNLP